MGDDPPQAVAGLVRPMARREGNRCDDPGCDDSASVNPSAQQADRITLADDLPVHSEAPTVTFGRGASLKRKRAFSAAWLPTASVWMLSPSIAAD
jgi:hypothetical protein